MGAPASPVSRAAAKVVRIWSDEGKEEKDGWMGGEGRGGWGQCCVGQCEGRPALPASCPPMRNSRARTPPSGRRTPGAGPPRRRSRLVGRGGRGWRGHEVLVAGTHRLPLSLSLSLSLSPFFLTCRLDAHVDDRLGRVRDGVAAKGDARAVCGMFVWMERLSFWPNCASPRPALSLVPLSLSSPFVLTFC